MRLVLPLLVVLALVAAGQKLVDPSTQRLLAAMAELGPIPGWRCASSAVYVYDPRRERPDATLVATLPEALAPPEVYVLSVEVNLRGGDTTVWTVSRGADPDAKPSRVFVLSPGILRAVTYERATICYSQLGNWHIVGDQALQ